MVDLIMTDSTAPRRECWTLAKTARIAIQITITTISRTAAFETGGVWDFLVVLSCGFTNQYPSGNCLRKHVSPHQFIRSAEMALMTRSLSPAYSFFPDD